MDDARHNISFCSDIHRGDNLGSRCKNLWALKLAVLCNNRYLTDLELRLHLAAEDIDAALEIDSSRALQRIPAAVQEVSHVRVG